MIPKKKKTEGEKRKVREQGERQPLVRDRSGTGSVCLLTGALRGLSYSREGEKEEEGKIAVVFEFSLLLSVSFSPPRCLSAA